MSGGATIIYVDSDHLMNQGHENSTKRIEELEQGEGGPNLEVANRQ